MPTREWIEANRENINEKRRQRYMQEKEKEDWPERREKMLQRKKLAKQMCPICQIMYGKVYLKHHLAGRHKVCEKKNSCVDVTE
jgi:hypothetical protein